MPRPTRPVPAAVSALVVAVAAAMATTSPASSNRRAEVYPVTGPSTITLSGHGYGHGHGMSQYGAEGAARAGLTWQQIIEFYYPGTSWGVHRGPIEVLITGDTSDDLVVVAAAGLKVTRLQPKKAWKVPANGATRWRMSGLADGRTRVDFRKGSSWRTWKSFAGDGQFSAPLGRLTLVKPSGRATYRGRLRSASVRPGQPARDTVNVVSLDAYLRGVVPLEIPALWSPDAVRAQAVAARTYAAAERSHPNASHYQICDTTQCQVYGGVDVEHPAATQAVLDTLSEGLVFDGRPAFAQFSSSNGGFSSAGSAPYLMAREDPYDGWTGNPHHTWSVVLDDAGLERHYPAIGDLTGIEVAQRDGNGEWGGRVLKMALVGTAGRADISGDTLRTVLGLKSSWFTFTVTPGAPVPKRQR
ncbi:MAG: SpoIID/LytB domain [Nocardioides sp.]|jgi:stage II sporulation protein D|uniref:SpoIID/LytB domain-containing protein n=1 Tax=Nocardioides sp. TaxID=35761 RepID=UPI0026297F67|nr:SpoIID/LytB domain-containing protein [Nocardioides sp.]MCW2835460.1 SpoIID/LytB domain [Nocardioides sp.]